MNFFNSLQLLYLGENNNQGLEKDILRHSVNNYSDETYLNHPTFGLLFRVCLVRDNQELFTTLYAQRLFFLVTTNANGLNFETISRSDARLLVETRLRRLRLNQSNFEYRQLENIYERTFQ